MKRVDEVTQRNAATAEEFAATAQELSAQASSLEEMVGQFRTDRSLPSTVPAKAASYSASATTELTGSARRGPSHV
jgi:methyl-accepting chemotaxis protein